MNSIPQIMELFLKSTAKALSSAGDSDFGHRMALIASANETMMLGLLTSLLHQQDEAIAQSGQRKRDWVVLRRDSRTLTTAFGELRFKRRYYRHRKTGEYAFLPDRYPGIEAYARSAAFMRCVWEDRQEDAMNLRAEMLQGLGGTERQKKQKTVDYLLNNWVRIRNQRHPGAVGCSAEGHVSHVLSARLSSRPLGWSKKNLMNVA